MVEFQKLIFRIGFTVVTTWDKSCSKKLERLCAKEVYTFIMDSEEIFYWKSLQLIRVSWSDFEASCILSQCLLGSVFHMFIHYQYLSLNKNKNGLRQMSLKYASIHQITPIFRNVHRKHDPEPLWQAYVWLYMYNSIIFCMKIYMFWK